MKKFKITSVLLFASVSLLTGCTVDKTNGGPYPRQMHVLKGPAITENTTDYTSGLFCVSDRISLNRKIRITVDKIPDKSGKVNSKEGYKLSQGVESMAITALTKINAIQVIERRNIDTFNIEQELMKDKRIGDNRIYKISGGRKIKYKPLLSGKVHGADYFITGAITEVNYNLSSGGQIINLSGLEIGTKTVRMNVAMDLRIVDVNNLSVLDSISLQKQFIGKRTKAGIYRFYDNDIVNFDAGSSIDEPLQVGVRSLVERGVAHLVGRIFNINVDQCYGNNIKIR